jgi:hypothetical protein
MWMVVKSVYQQQPDLLIYLAVTLLALRKRPVNTPLAIGKLTALLDETSVHSSKCRRWHTKNTGTLTSAWHDRRLLW